MAHRSAGEEGDWRQGSPPAPPSRMATPVTTASHRAAPQPGPAHLHGGARRRMVERGSDVWDQAVAVRPGLGGSYGSPLAGRAPEAEAASSSNGRRGPPDSYTAGGLPEWRLASIHNQPYRA